MQTVIEDTSVDIEAKDDGIIVLGVASVETKGLASIGEMVGGNQTPGISED